MGFGGKERIRNLIWIARISRINRKLNEGFARDINPRISGQKPILGFREKLLLVGSFSLCCLLVGMLPCSSMYTAAVGSSVGASPLLEELLVEQH